MSGPSQHRVDVDTNQNGRLVIGRDGTGIDYPLDDEYVSTRHAALTVVRRGRVSVEDLGSTNGTWIDGRQLGYDSVLLSTGTYRMRVGHTDIVLHVT